MYRNRICAHYFPKLTISTIFFYRIFFFFLNKCISVNPLRKTRIVFSKSLILKGSKTLLCCCLSKHHWHQRCCSMTCIQDACKRHQLQEISCADSPEGDCAIGTVQNSSPFMQQLRLEPVH